MYINNAQRDVDFLQDFTIQIIGASWAGSEQSWNCDTIGGTRGKWDAIAEQMTDICAQSGHLGFSGCGKKRNVEVKRRQTTTFFTAEKRNRTDAHEAYPVM